MRPLRASCFELTSVPAVRSQADGAITLYCVCVSPGPRFSDLRRFLAALRLERLLWLEFGGSRVLPKSCSSLSLTSSHSGCVEAHASRLGVFGASVLYIARLFRLAPLRTLVECLCCMLCYTLLPPRPLAGPAYGNHDLSRLLKRCLLVSSLLACGQSHSKFRLTEHGYQPQSRQDSTDSAHSSRSKA